MEKETSNKGTRRAASRADSLVKHLKITTLIPDTSADIRARPADIPTEVRLALETTLRMHLSSFLQTHSSEPTALHPGFFKLTSPVGLVAGSGCEGKRREVALSTLSAPLFLPDPAMTTKCLKTVCGSKCHPPWTLPWSGTSSV